MLSLKIQDVANQYHESQKIRVQNLVQDIEVQLIEKLMTMRGKPLPTSLTVEVNSQYNDFEMVEAREIFQNEKYTFSFRFHHGMEDSSWIVTIGGWDAIPFKKNVELGPTETARYLGEV